MTTLTEKFHSGGFLVTEANGRRSRDVGTILSGAGVVLTGTVLAKITVGTASSAAFAGNTGSGAMGAVTLSAGAKPGVYKLVIIEPATDAGKFAVEDPDGIIIGTGTVAVAFSAGGLAFTLADATDFIAGDGFNITVAAGSGKYVPYDPTGADGRQIAAAILWGTGRDSIDATSADQSATLIVRAAEINISELVWGAGVTTDAHKTAALASLAALGVIGR